MIIIGFGANLDGAHGAPEETFQHALEAIMKRGIRIVGTSSVWKTSPVDTDEAQDWYTNAVIAVETEAAAEELLAILLDIETEFGRIRTTRNAARSIDLDLICYHDEIINVDDTLIVPHPRMHERGFVLLPLKEIAPDWTHPVGEWTIDELIERLPADQLAEKPEEQRA